MASATAIDLLAPVHRLSVERYLQMAEVGILPPEAKVELIDGVVVEMSAQGVPHVRAVAWLLNVLAKQVPGELMVIAQSTLRLTALESAPEPDVCIAEGADVGARDARPLLAIEVSTTSLRYDRTTKARLYARSGAPEYWVVNLVDGVVEVHRDPAGDAWGSESAHGPGTTLAPVRLPGVVIDVTELLEFAAVDSA